MSERRKRSGSIKYGKFMDQMRNRYVVNKGSALQSKLLGEVVRHLVIGLYHILRFKRSREVKKFYLNGRANSAK
jgi:hypothetical protein